MLQRATQNMQVPAGVGGRIELPLPMIERVVITPLIVQFVTSTQPANNDWFGLSHQRDQAAPTGASLNQWLDPSIWLQWNFNSASAPTQRIDLRGLEFELAGPQAFLVFNSEGGTLGVNATMWYETHEVGIIEWASLALATSFEE